MGLSDSSPVQGLEINCSPGGAIPLGAYHHSRAPGCWLSHGDGLYDTKPDIPVQLILDLLGPVDGDRYWLVHSYRFCLGISVELEGREICHQWELLVLALIEC